MFRVQFTISDTEHTALKAQAASEGFPNVPELCKHRALQDVPGKRRDYGELYRLMVRKITELPPGKEFTLRDLIDTPPALLGRWLYENVANGTIPDVKHLGEDSYGTQRYQKSEKENKVDQGVRDDG